MRDKHSATDLHPRQCGFGTRSHDVAAHAGRECSSLLPQPLRIAAWASRGDTELGFALRCFYDRTPERLPISDLKLKEERVPAQESRQDPKLKTAMNPSTALLLTRVEYTAKYTQYCICPFHPP